MAASLLVAEARVSMPDPGAIVAPLCAHLAEHGAMVSADRAGHVVMFDTGMGLVTAEAGALAIRVQARDLADLYYLRMAFAAHVKEFAPPPEPEIVWSGDGSDLVTPPNFRLARVTAIRDITPHMRRLTFAGSDLSRFATDANLHVGLVIPPAGEEPVWPTVGKDGLVKWHEGPGRPALRRYTIRRHDMAAGTLDVDFLLHADAGPGSAFARHARPGDMIGIAGPGGGGVRPGAGWYLLAGDETALPALARILETLPAHARGVAVIEVADAAEEQAIEAPAGFAIRWLHRDGAATTLADAVRAVPFPDEGTSVFAWAGCELADFKAIRSYLRKERGLKKDQHLVVAYWRRGKSEDETRKAEDDDH